MLLMQANSFYHDDENNELNLVAGKNALLKLLP